MDGSTRTLVTVVAESAMEALLVRELVALGIRGFTIHDARGFGEGGARPADWEQSRNVSFQIVCTEREAEAIVGRLRDGYWNDWSVVCWTSPVTVFRTEKF